MAKDNNDTKPVAPVGFLAALDAKIAALQSLRSAYLAAQAVGALGQVGDVPAEPSAAPFVGGGDAGLPTELPVGAFNGKSLPACITLYLETAKRKKTIKEIATALRDGGIESTSDNFEGVITGALNRLKSRGEVLRFKDGWGLPAWYPPSLRTAAVPAATGKKKAKKSKGKKSASASSVKAELAPAPTSAKLPTAEPENAGTPQISAQQQIVQFFGKHPGREFSKEEILGALKMRSQTLTFLLGKLAHRHVLAKTESGAYKMITG
jgi:hypothetical protein